MAGKKKSKVWYEAGLFQKDGSVKVEKVAEPQSGRRKVLGSLKRLLGLNKKDPSSHPISEHAKNMLMTFGIGIGS
jgi:hypothetical protein